MARAPFVGIKPGDIGFDGGQGLFGWIIRRATGAYGHVWVYHKFLGTDSKGREQWDTVEAGPRGLRHQTRTRPPVKVVRMWRTSQEQQALLDASEACVGKKYGWGEIVRLALHTVGVRIKGTRDNADRMICSNHAATCIQAANPALATTMPYRPPHIWPQRLAEWCDWVFWTRDRAQEARP